MGEDDAEAAYQKTHAETVKKTTLINLDETRSPTSLVTPTMNGDEQIKEVCFGVVCHIHCPCLFRSPLVFWVRQGMSACVS